MSAPEPKLVIAGCQVERVIDGDTLELSLTRKFRVRLVDCWAPETKQTDHVSEKARGKVAKEFMERQAFWMDQTSKQCTLEIVPDGDGDIGDGLTFGRVVGRVWMHGSEESLGAIMRRFGFAFATKKQLEASLDETDKQVSEETRNNGGDLMKALKTVLGFGLCLFAMAASAHAGSGIYSLEQECRTGNCPLTAGPATCVCVGHTPDGSSCILTAAHCVSQASNRFYAVGSSGQRYPATVVFRDDRLDLAALKVSSKLSRAKVRMSPPGKADMVTVSGLLTRRFQESSGYLDRIDSHGRIWSRKLWSHPGMSGGAMTDEAGRLFGIHTATVTGSDETLAAPIKPAIEAFERRYGRLQFESGSVITQQGFANFTDCRSRSRSVVRSSYCPCPQTPSPAASAPARVSVSVDYERISREFFARYGEQLRGRDGVNGRDGSPGKVDLNQLAAVIVSRYGERLRGERGEPGKDGGRGAQGQKGDQGPRGLTAVPSEGEVRKWLQQYAAEFEAKETPQRVVIVDGQTGNVIDDETYQPGEAIVLDVRRLVGE